MGKVLHFEACPRCRKGGRDRSGDNYAVYSDGSGFCFSCGYHRHAKTFVRKENLSGNANKDVLPFDFTREVPAAGWRWLLQYGLPYTYWQPLVGYSESSQRLVITVGSPTVFSIGRYIGPDADAKAKTDRTFRKWRIWGDRGGYCEVLGESHGGCAVLVEDIISGHKVAQVAPTIPLFGTKVSDEVIKKLKALKRPVALWLDADQYPLLAPKLNRLQTFLGTPVRYIKTEKDPKSYPVEQIKEILV